MAPTGHGLYPPAPDLAGAGRSFGRRRHTHRPPDLGFFMSICHMHMYLLSCGEHWGQCSSSRGVMLGSRCARLSFWTLKVPPPAPPFMGAGPRVYPLGTPLGDHIHGTYRCGGCPLVCTILCVCMYMLICLVLSHAYIAVHAPLLELGCARGGLDRSRVKEVTSPAGEVGVTYPCKDLCRLCLDPRPQPFEVSPGVIGCM